MSERFLDVAETQRQSRRAAAVLDAAAACVPRHLLAGLETRNLEREQAVEWHVGSGRRARELSRREGTVAANEDSQIAGLELVRDARVTQGAQETAEPAEEAGLLRGDIRVA